MKNVFLLHGMSCRLDETFGIGLKEDLKKLGFCIIEPHFTLEKDITFENWTEEMDKYKTLIKAGDIFICHSLSTNFIIKYLSKNDLKCDLFIAVAGGLRNARGVTAKEEKFLKFIPTSKDFAFCIKNIKHRFNIFNKDDHIWTQQEIMAYTKELDAEGVELDYGGHFGRNANIENIPEILDLVCGKYKHKNGN